MEDKDNYEKTSIKFLFYVMSIMSEEHVAIKNSKPFKDFLIAQEKLFLVIALILKLLVIEIAQFSLHLDISLDMLNKNETILSQRA